MKRIIAFFAVFLAISTGLFSAENTITAVSVSGLKRTKPYIIEKQLHLFIGRDAESIDINEVIAVLQSAAIVEPLTVAIEDTPEGDGKVLAVTVREKWTIIPVPFFSITGSGWALGGAFMDTNAFGIKDTMMVMGSGGTSGWMANGMYIHSPNTVGDFGWNIRGMFLWQDKENTDQRDELTLRRYNSITINPAVGLSYKLTNLITPSIGVGYKNVMLRDTESPVNAPDDGVQALSFTPGIGITHHSWDGYFLNEKSATLKYNYTLVIGDADVHTVSLHGVFNYSMIPGFRLTAKSGLIYAAPSASPYFESSPGNVSVHILPPSYSAVDFASFSLGLEKYLFKFRFGTVALSAGYQAVYSHGELLRYQFDHGPVAMVQMYLSRVAIPGIGLGGAYNVDKNTWQYAFNIGMMF